MSKSEEAWKDRFTTPPYGEPPARQHSFITVIMGILTVTTVVLAAVSAVASAWAFGFIYPAAAFALISIVLFLLAKKSERSDTKRHGADRDSWMNYMGPG